MIVGLQTKSMVFSAVLHVTVFSVFLVGNPFSSDEPPKFDVLTVSLAVMPEQPKPAPKEEPKPPKPKPKKKVPKKKKTPIKNPKPIEKKTPVPVENPEATVPEETQPSPEEESASQDSDTTTTEFSEQISNAEFTGAFDNPNFDYPDWNYRGFAKIVRNWTNHASPREAVSATIYFHVLKSGRIYGATIKKSSGYAVYDQGCLRAVQRAGVLPPLPPEFQYEELGVSLVFPWKPN